MPWSFHEVQTPLASHAARWIADSVPGTHHYAPLLLIAQLPIGAAAIVGEIPWAKELLVPHLWAISTSSRGHTSDKQETGNAQ
jgi:hypothetical protein